MFIRKKIFALILLFSSGGLPHCTLSHDKVIQKQLFDLNWKFSPENPDLPNKTNFNDINWTAIDLPHECNSETAIKELSGKTVWYWKNFEIPENWREKKIEIEFEGISAQHELFLNGVPVKCSEKRNQIIQADITSKLNSKEKNFIAIRIKIPTESETKAKPEAGIFGHVWLVIKEAGTNP